MWIFFAFNSLHRFSNFSSSSPTLILKYNQQDKQTVPLALLDNDLKTIQIDGPLIFQILYKLFGKEIFSEEDEQKHICKLFEPQ